MSSVGGALASGSKGLKQLLVTGKVLLELFKVLKICGTLPSLPSVASVQVLSGDFSI